MKLRTFLTCTTLAAGTAFLIIGCLALQDARRVLTETSAQLADTQRAALAAVKSVAWMTDQRAGEALAEVRAFRRSADLRLASIHTDARQQVAEAVLQMDLRVAEVTDSVRTAQQDVSLTLAETRRLQTAGTHAVELVTPQILGAAAAAKVALGEHAQAARRVDAALPTALAQVELIGRNVARATDEYAATGAETRRAMHNFAEATRPLPKWLRYPLSITGAVAPTVAGAVGAAAATGAFR